MRRSIPFLIVVLAACGEPAPVGTVLNPIDTAVNPIDTVVQIRLLKGTWSGEGQIVAGRDGALWRWSKTTGDVLTCWHAVLPPLVLSQSNTFEFEGEVGGAIIMDSPFPEVLSGKGPARFSGRLENNTLRFLVERTDIVMKFGPDDMTLRLPERVWCQRT